MTLDDLWPIFTFTKDICHCEKWKKLPKRHMGGVIWAIPKKVIFKKGGVPLLRALSRVEWGQEIFVHSRIDSTVTHLYDNLAKSTIRKMGRQDLESVVKSTMARLIRTHSLRNGSTSDYDFQIYPSEMRKVNSRVKLSSSWDLLCFILILIIITTNFINISTISMDSQDDVLCKICCYDCPASAMVKLDECGCSFCKEVILTMWKVLLGYG